MYAPHASPARARSAAHDRNPVDGMAEQAPAPQPSLGDDRALGGDDPSPTWPADDTLVPAAATGAASAVAALAALAALYVAYRLLRAHRPWAGGRSADCTTGWYGIATGLVGLTALAPLVGGWLGVGGMRLATAVIAGGLASGAAFLPALLSMSRVAVPTVVRARRVLDGIIVGLCLMLCVWILVIAPHGSIESGPFWIIMFHCCVLSTAVVCVLTPIAGSPESKAGPRLGDRGAFVCVAGVAASTLGVGGLAYVLAQPSPVGWLLLPVAALLIGAPVLIGWGTRLLGQNRPFVMPSALVIAVPVALAPAMALGRLVTGGDFDRAEMMLGTLTAFAVGLRQVLVSGLVPYRPVHHAASGTAPVKPTPRVVAAVRLSTASPVEPRADLPTRRHILAAVSAARAQPRRSGSLLVVGLDGLSGVADRDEVLREVGRRLRTAVTPREPAAVAGESDLVARWSDSAFAVLTWSNVLRAYALANRLQGLLAQAVTTPGGPVSLSSWVGLTQIDTAPSDDDVLRRAEVALRRARQLGPGRVEWYDATVEEVMQRQQIIERDLPDALCGGDLHLIYQPIVDLVQERPLAVEALLRWHHPELGTLMPSDVIPVAEQTGLIGDMGRWVLGQALAQLAAWRSDGRDLSVCVNISPRQFEAGDVAGHVQSLLAAHGLPADRLVLEVEESAIGDGSRLVEPISVLRRMGVRTALDQFGAGAASLANLRLPIDMVKISSSLFGATGAPAPGRASGALPLIDVLVGVGRRLGFEVVAHGLEEPEQLSVVRTAGCRMGQGHIFARPLPAEHTEAYLASFPARV